MDRVTPASFGGRARAHRPGGRCAQRLVWALLLWNASSGPAHGQASEGRLRAVLLQPLDERVQRRIDGQTRDLPWRIEGLQVDAGAVLDGPLARSLSTPDDARVLLQVTAPDTEGTVTLRVYDHATGGVVVRRFPLDPPGDAAALSAQHEAVALAVRATLRAVASAAADETGAGSSPRAGAAEGSGLRESAPSRAVAPGVGEEAPGEAGDAAAAPSGVLLGLGAHVALDGESEPLAWGPQLRLAIELGGSGTELELQGNLGIAADAGDERAQLRLTRHSVLAGVSLGVALGESLALRPGLFVGLAHLQRTTEGTAENLSPTEPSRHTGALLQASVEARLFLSRGDVGRVGLSLSGAAQVDPEPTTFRYTSGGEPRDLSLWPVFPAVALAIFVQSE